MGKKRKRRSAAPFRLPNAECRPQSYSCFDERIFLTPPRTVLALMRRSLEAREGRVLIRGLGAIKASVISSVRRFFASERFISCVRNRSA